MGFICLSVYLFIYLALDPKAEILCKESNTPSFEDLTYFTLRHSERLNQ